MELQLVERVELKLLLTKTDEQLSTALNTFLAPLLQKLASSNPEVVRKVVEVLRFIKMRKNESGSVKIPLDKLIELYHNSMFDFSPGILRQNRQVLSFMRLGLDDSEISLASLLNKLVYGLRNDTVDNSDVRFNTGEQFSLFLTTLLRVSMPQTEVQLGSWHQEDVLVMRNRLTQLFLLDFRKAANAQPILSESDASFIADHNQKLGLTLLTTNESGITAIRKAVIKVAHEFPNEFKNVLVAAMGDPMLDISRQARSDVFKLRDFDTTSLQHWAIKGNISLSTEVVELIIRERAFDDVDPNVILVPFRRSDLRLRQTVLRLLRELVISGKCNWGASVDFQMNKLLHQYIIDDGWPRSQLHSSAQTQLRQLCYELIGAFAPSKSTLMFLFQSLERDSPDMSQSIQKSLSRILEAKNVSIEAEKLLDIIKSSHSNRTRYAAVRFTVSQLEPSDATRQAICLLALNPSRNHSDVISEAQNGFLVDNDSDLPDFDSMLHALTTTMSLASEPPEVVNTALIYLLACLIRYLPSTSTWQADITSSLSIMGSPIEEKIRDHRSPKFMRLLFPLLLSRVYYSSVTLLLRKILTLLPQDDGIQASFSDVVKVSDLIQLLSGDASEYGSFVAEFLPQLAPNTEFNSSGSPMEVLAGAYHAAILNKPADKILDVAVRTKNVDVIQVLAVSNLVPNIPEVLKSVTDSQMTLACLSLYADDETRNSTFEKLVKSTPSSFDHIVTNGEAISVVASGWHSRVLQDKYPYLRSRYDATSGDLKSGNRLWNLEDLALKNVVSDIRGSPESRRKASVRLLCLTQYTFYDAESLSRVADGIQSCFMSLLSDSDEVTQESAGRGLGILFENGASSPDIQQSLLNTLVGSFTNDDAARKHAAGTLTADTQVFEPGVLPSEPNGKSGSISTYKDVLSLANETGDSSLVYKFMSLSASSQVWTGRKGIAFSLEQILARSELADQIPSRSALGKKLIPKLFRYLYDPMEVTKQAMGHIWSAIIPTARKSNIVQLYLPEITIILLEGVVDREWRVREASASALSDLISKGLLKNSVELWRAGFRAVDDVKESVAKAGSELLKSMTNSLVRSSSAGNLVDLSEIVPFLLRGLNTESTLKYSIDTLLKLSETKSFKPWAAQVVEELSLQLSSLEPQALNYLALNSSQSLVDEVRQKALRDGPIMRGIENMVEKGSPTPDEMWKILPSLVKKSVGVPSKLAGARLLTLTCMHTYGAEKHGSEELLRAAFNELWSSNEIVSQSYASATSYLCRQLPLPLVVSLIDELRKKFVFSEPDNSRTREVVGLVLKNMSINASDVFTSISSRTLPLAFVGKFTDQGSVFEKVWDSNTGGPLSIRLYTLEILQLCLEIFQNSGARNLKVASSKATFEALTRAGDGKQIEASRELIGQLAKSLLQELSGRSWPKKEYLFDALVAIYPFLNDISNPELKKLIEERILNEIQRKNTDYKLGIIKGAARFVNYLNEQEGRSDISLQVQQQLVSIITDPEIEDSDELVSRFKAAYTSLNNQDLIIKLLEHVLGERGWKFRVAVCDAIQTKPFDAHTWHITTAKCASDQNYVVVRIAWSRAAAKFRDHEIVIDDVNDRLKIEKSAQVIDALKPIVSR